MLSRRSNIVEEKQEEKSSKQEESSYIHKGLFSRRPEKETPINEELKEPSPCMDRSRFSRPTYQEDLPLDTAYIAKYKCQRRNAIHQHIRIIELTYSPEQLQNYKNQIQKCGRDTYLVEAVKSGILFSNGIKFKDENNLPAAYRCFEDAILISKVYENEIEILKDQTFESMLEMHFFPWNYLSVAFLGKMYNSSDPYKNFTIPDLVEHKIISEEKPAPTEQAVRTLRVR